MNTIEQQTHPDISLYRIPLDINIYRLSSMLQSLPIHKAYEYQRMSKYEELKDYGCE